MKKPLFFIAFSILFATGPILVLLLASGIADLYGCELNEGYANPCIVLGTDIGDLLYAAAVLPWLSFFTIPVGALLFVIGLVWLIVVLSKRRQGTGPA